MNAVTLLASSIRKAGGIYIAKLRGSVHRRPTPGQSSRRALRCKRAGSRKPDEGMGDTTTELQSLQPGAPAGAHRRTQPVWSAAVVVDITRRSAPGSRGGAAAGSRRHPYSTPAVAAASGSIFLRALVVRDL